MENSQIERGLRDTAWGSPRLIENFITEAENGISWIKIGDVAESDKYITTTRNTGKDKAGRS